MISSKNPILAEKPYRGGKYPYSLELNSFKLHVDVSACTS